ncbi:hypothetical protein P9139_18495 [Curtobacterium flaccumfaciens]|nr:hypothetical protein P9139_18495 [Curtobacterium flaccumfaciens]
MRRAPRAARRPESRGERQFSRLSARDLSSSTSLAPPPPRLVHSLEARRTLHRSSARTPVVATEPHDVAMTTSPPPLLRVAEHDRAAARALHRRHHAGFLVRVTDGVYLDAATWRDLTPAQRHLVTARALAPTIRPTAAFSHVTAALAFGWPMIDQLPERVHVTDAATPRTEHRAHLVRHAGPPEVGSTPSTFAGLPVTSRLRTAIDLVTTLEPAVASVAIDHAVRQGALDVEHFTEALPPRPRRGSVRAHLVAAALDAGHESVGESYTAIRMVELGLPVPDVQHEFRHADGRVDRVDFWFPELGVIVEFDGKQKYTDADMLDGRNPGDAVWHEKIREDRLRSLPRVRTVVRPTWWHLVELERLRTLFRQHRVVV